MAEQLRTRIQKRKEEASLPSLLPGQRKYTRLAKPDIALGLSAGKDIEDVRYNVGIIILFSLITGILSTIAYALLNDETKEREILVAVFSVSWFVLISFIFLLFNQTRLLHIIFFSVILVLSGIVYGSLKDNDTVKNLLLATIVFACIPTFILVRYWAGSRKEEEIIELKTEERLRKREDEIKQIIKMAKEEGAKEMEEKLSKKYMLQEQIGEKAIEKFLAGRAGGEGKKKKSKKS
jgi:hypothetical protein